MARLNTPLGPTTPTPGPMDEVVVGMENGSPKWVTINGTKVHGVFSIDMTMENKQLVRIQMELIVGNVQVVPANIDDPQFADIKKALNI